MPDRTYEARKVGDLLQIRGDRPGGKWRNATTAEDVANAEAVLEAGGTMVVPEGPSTADVARVRNALEAASLPSPAALAASARLSELDDTPHRSPPRPVAPPQDAPPAAPVAATRPVGFLLEGKDVPASPRTLAAAEELARAIAADAEAVDSDPNAAVAWKGARIRLGDLLREVVSFEFGRPEDFRDGLGTFAVIGVR